jgi:hypothetical protein
MTDSSAPLRHSRPSGSPPAQRKRPRCASPRTRGNSTSALPNSNVIILRRHGPTTTQRAPGHDPRDFGQSVGRQTSSNRVRGRFADPQFAGGAPCRSPAVDRPRASSSSVVSIAPIMSFALRACTSRGREPARLHLVNDPATAAVRQRLAGDGVPSMSAVAVRRGGDGPAPSAPDRARPTGIALARLASAHAGRSSGARC